MSARSAAFVTGASAGIGASFARELADRGSDLVVVARRADRLDLLKEEIETKTDVSVTPVPADLSTADGQNAAVRSLLAVGDRLTLVVLAAGSAGWGRLQDLDADAERARVELNVVAPTVLARAALPALTRSRRTGLVVVASLAAWQATPYMATYAASKAYQVSLAEALAEEVRGTDTVVLALCPGPVATEFHWVAGTQSLMERVPVLQPREVARAGLQRVERGVDGAQVLGWRNRASAAGVTVLPRRVVRRISARIHRPPDLAE